MTTLLNTLQIRLHGGGGGASLYSSAFPWPRSHNKMGEIQSQIHNKCNYKYAMTNAKTKRGKKASLSLLLLSPGFAYTTNISRNFHCLHNVW